MLLQHEIEKIKLIMEIYIKEKQNEEILFNPDEHLSKSEDLEEIFAFPYSLQHYS